MSRRLSVLIWLVGLILLAFAVRTYDLDGKSIWSDESLSLYRAQESVPFILSGQIVIQDVPTQDTQPPLYFLLLHILMTAAGTSTFVARYLSVLASLLILPLLYVLGRRLLGTTAGLLTALIGTISPLYLWYAQEIRMYTLLVALSVASMYALIRAVGNGRPEARWGLIYFAITAAMVYTHYSAFFLLGFQGIYLVVQAMRRRRWWLLAPLAVAGLVTLPVLPFVVRRLGLGPERDFHFVPLWIILRDLWNAFSLGLSVDFYRVYPLDIVFLGVLVVGVVASLSLFRARGGGRRPGIVLFLLGYLLVPILALYAASYVKPMYQGARHLMIVSPAYYLLLAVGLVALSRHVRLAFAASTLVILVGTSLSTSNYFTDPDYFKDDLRSLARYFQAHHGPNDVLVLSDAVLTLAFHYYLGEDAPIDALPRFGTHLQPDFPDQIRALMDRYDRLWFMSPHPPVRAWLRDNLFRSGEVYFEGMNIPVMAEIFESAEPFLAEPPADLRGETTELDGQLAFHGYAVPHNPVRAGEILTAVLYWEPRTVLTSDYHIAVTLTDDLGNVWGQGDAAPFGGLHPTSTWEAGKVVRLRHELRVNPGTPPGVYHLELRVYDPTSGNTLTGGVGKPLIDLGDIEVVRPDTTALPSTVRPQVVEDVIFGRRLRLLGVDVPLRVRRPGDAIPLATYWQALREVDQDYRLWVRLVDADGQLLAERTVSPSSAGYPTSQWRAGDVLQGQHRLIVPANTPPGDVIVVLSVVDPAGRPLTAHRLRWLPLGGTEVRLATVEIAPREKIVTEIPAMDYTMDAALAGVINLLGYDLNPILTPQVRATKEARPPDLQPNFETRNPILSPAEGLSDDPKLVLSEAEGSEILLYWRTSAVIDGNFKVTVQVLSPDNQVVAQHDSVPANWTRPTTGWLPGEVIADPHPLMIAPQTPAGSYRLIAALYDPVSNSRVSVVQDGEVRDHVVLGTLVVR